MSWCFAIINGRLSEIYFEKKKGKIKFLGHCYVKKSQFKTKKEQKWIEEDTKKFRFFYKDGIYKDKSHSYKQVKPNYLKTKNIKALSPLVL